MTRIAHRPRPRELSPAAAAPLLVALVLLGGCAVRSPAPEVPAADASAVLDDHPRSRRVALDFVGAMKTLPALAPNDTTLYAARPRSRFGEILVTALQREGYDIRLGAAGSPVSLDYDVRAEAGRGEPGARYTFGVVADGIRLERRYAADLVGIRPLSTMRVDGRDLTSGAIATALPEPASRRRTAPPRAVSPPPRGTRNVYETRRSNYADLLVDYATVSRHVMVFPNDSLVMGRDNKRLARRIAAAFDPERDLVSVLGCSHGPTALENGNETLATGRAYRVKEAFMLAGIAADLVLEEGCWAGRHFDKLPARGVLVTHKRRARG